LDRRRTPLPITAAIPHRAARLGLSCSDDSGAR
jgi:hypothetical protein